MTLRFLFILPFMMLQHELHAQTVNSDLILGSWTYLTKTEGYSQTLDFYTDGTFEMKWQATGKEPGISTGTYEIKDGMLSLHFESGQVQNNNIETLDEDRLQIRYIENVFRYTRQDF